MKLSKRVLAVAGTTLLSAVSVGVVMAGSATAAPNAPQAVTCIAPSTGAVGPTGPQGETGATGPIGQDAQVFNGAVRVAHLVATPPNCADIPALCGIVYPGLEGATGPVGATGPQGDTGLVAGRARVVHPRSVCLVDPVCTYAMHGPIGATGLTGDTGAQGDTGLAAPNGGRRTAHRTVAGVQYGPGDTIALSDCVLAATGSWSTNVAPWAILFVLVGAGVVVFSRRRRMALHA
jgi:hypothetical protein